MRTIQTTVYTFDELTDAAKDRARDWWRSAAEFSAFTGHDVVAGCLETLTQLGFTIDGVSWSGFYSQGDGASFAGSWRRRDARVADALAERPTDTELREIAEGLAALIAKYPGDLTATLTRATHRYSHEMTVQIDVDYDIDEPDDENTPDLSPADSDALVELCRDAMRWVYRQLESAYDWEMADEQVDESIRANDYEFTEDGALA